MKIKAKIMLLKRDSWWSLKAIRNVDKIYWIKRLI